MKLNLIMTSTVLFVICLGFTNILVNNKLPLFKQITMLISQAIKLIFSQRYLLRFPTIAFLLVIALSLPAMAQPLTLSEIESFAFKAQLVEAQDINTALDIRKQCYIDKDENFQARSQELQITVGGLYRKKQRLSSELAEKKSKAEGLRRMFEKAKQDMAIQTRDMNKIEVQIQAKQTKLDDCKKQLWIFNFVCKPTGEVIDAVGELLGLDNSLRKLSAERDDLSLKMNRLQNHLNTTESELHQAEKQFNATQGTLAKTKQEIIVTETQVKVIKASLREIRDLTHNYSVELDNFRNTFTKFKSLDLNSDRRFIVDRLRRKSANLNDLLTKAQSLLHEDGLQLPNGERICAN